jgi:hypothetical protein
MMANRAADVGATVLRVRTRWNLVVSLMPPATSFGERTLVHTGLEAGWDPELVWML